MNQHPAILSVATALPGRRYSQREIYDALAKQWESYRRPRVREAFLNSDIEFRNLCLEIETFAGNETIDAMHARFASGAADLGARAIRPALALAGVGPEEIGFLVVATCTGYLCPGLSAVYARDLGFSDRLQRADLVGMGCAGALPAIQRAHDFVKANPGTMALAVTVEVCSACYYLDDSLETIIGNAICGDGAAAVVVGPPAGRRKDPGPGPDSCGPLPSIRGFRTLLDTTYIESVGFQHREGRLRIVLSKDLRDMAGGMVSQVVEGILEEHRLKKSDIDHWILHPGGRKIIDAVRTELGLTADQVRHSASVLRNCGNMSSPTVLFVLRELLSAASGSGRPRPGELGMMVAMGPGLAVEGALLAW